MFDQKDVQRRTPILLMLVLLLGLALRLWGIRFGLPYAYHIDERSYVVGALNLGQGQIYGYPQQVGLVNVLFGEYGLYYMLGRVFGLFHDTGEFAKAFYRDPTVFYLIGRLTVVFLGVLTCLLLFWLGRLLRNEAVGLIAALALAFNFLHIRESHFTTPDVPQGLGFLIVVVLCVLALRRESVKYLLVASFIGGIVIAWKWASLPLLLPLWFVAWRLGGTDSRGACFWLLTSTTALAAMGFAVFSPQLLLVPGPYIEWAKRDYISGSAGGYSGFLIDTVPGWAFYLKMASVGMGVAGLVLSLFGLILWARDLIKGRNPDLMVVVLLFAGYFAIMASSRRYFARYVVPMAPFLALAAAWTVEYVYRRWLIDSRRWSRLGLAVLVLALVLQPALNAGRTDYLLTREDTRTLAKHWIEANLPAGSRIATDWEIHSVPLATEEVPQPYSTYTYQVTAVGGEGLSSFSVRYYRASGYDYLIATSYIYNLELIDRARDAQRDTFYQSLQEQLDLVKVFKPYTGDKPPPFIFDEIFGPLISQWKRDRPGPTVEIYKVHQ